MCIFSRPVLSVADTNIFARLGEDGWQYLVYQMSFETEEINAMVLPLPVQTPSRETESVEFISLRENEDFFEKLALGFPVAVPSKFSRGYSYGSKPQTDSEVLEVHEVGDYVASLVPTIADFDRLDERFRLPAGSWDQIPQYKDYGFAVFQLKKLKGKPHPIGLKFKTRLQDNQVSQIFFPTIHIHDGEVHDREHFDHDLFLQSPELDSLCGRFKERRKLTPDKATGFIRSKWKAGQFCNVDACKGIVDGEALVHRVQIQGLKENKDAIVDLKSPGAPLQSMIFPNVTWPWGTGLAAVVGAVWFFERRNKVSGKLAQRGQGADFSELDAN